MTLAARIISETLHALSEAAGFNVFITKDGNLPYQQNLKGREIAVLILRPRTQSLPSLLSQAPKISDLLATLNPGSVTAVVGDRNP